MSFNYGINFLNFYVFHDKIDFKENGGKYVHIFSIDLNSKN